MARLSRRRLLETALQGAAGVSLGMVGLSGATARAQNGRAASAGNSAGSLAPGFHVLQAGPTNVLAVECGDGVALVDGGSAAVADDLLRRVAALPGGSNVHTLFNTHWHPDHTGLNEPLARAGTTVVSHVNTRLWLTTDVTWPWSDSTIEPLPADALPGRTFYAEEKLEVGGKRVRCGHLRDCPHTDGDIYVFFEDDNVMALGDAVYGEGWPDIDWWTGGWIGGLVGGLDMILTVSDDDTVFVPARGPVLDRSDLLSQYRMYGLIWESLLKTLYSGGGPDEAVAAEPTKEFDDVMGGESEAFVRRAFESLWAYLSPDA